MTKTSKASAKTTTAAKKDRKAAKTAAPAANLRNVKEVASANRGQDTIVILHDGSTHTVTDYAKNGVPVKVGDNFDQRKTTYLAKLRERSESKGAGHLAKGLDAHNAPHSVKAHADNKKAERKPAPAKAAKKADRKAARAEKAAPKSDDTRRITLVDRKFTFGGEGTTRRESWDACVATIQGKGTVADYIKAGGKAKYLPRWAGAGAIKLS